MGGGDQAELVARLEGAGRDPRRRGAGRRPGVVMADPEGNEFCLLALG
ncbi:VOC family protein [Actinoplanes sp. CA-142083]